MRTELGERGTSAESRAALGALALEEGRASEAESLAREAVVTFAGQAAPDNEAIARATLAQALLAQGRTEPAQQEVDRALALVRNPTHVLARMPVAIAAARVRAASNIPAAVKELDGVRMEAQTLGLARFEFEARRAAAEIEGRRSLAADRRHRSST